MYAINHHFPDKFEKGDGRDVLEHDFTNGILVIEAAEVEILNSVKSEAT